jgi:hypothetical protein
VRAFPQLAIIMTQSFSPILIPLLAVAYLILVYGLLILASLSNRRKGV